MSSDAPKPIEIQNLRVATKTYWITLVTLILAILSFATYCMVEWDRIKISLFIPPVGVTWELTHPAMDLEGKGMPAFTPMEEFHIYNLSDRTLKNVKVIFVEKDKGESFTVSIGDLGGKQNEVINGYDRKKQLWHGPGESGFREISARSSVQVTADGYLVPFEVSMEKLGKNDTCRMMDAKIKAAIK